MNKVFIQEIGSIRLGKEINTISQNEMNLYSDEQAKNIETKSINKERKYFTTNLRFISNRLIQSNFLVH